MNNQRALKLYLSILSGLLSIFFGNNHVYSQSQQNYPSGLQLSTFDVDATPPVGSNLVYDPMIGSCDIGLRARGIVLLGAGKPIVLCAVDWIGIANDSQDAFRKALADAAGTIPERVAIHTLHQHDTPECDFGAERMLKKTGEKPLCFEGSFAREVIRRLEVAVKNSLEHTQPVTHLGMGEAQVYKVASNRRILGADGHVRATRYTACKDSALIAEPEGLIDPMISLISFWNGNKPIAVLSYYAVHPQSYYRTGIANPDFPGIARFLRQLALPDALHVHFNGAGGNLGAGKYNDGSHKNRLVLAERLADGMKRAWDNNRIEPINTSDVAWLVEPVALPPAKDLAMLNTKIKSQNNIFIANNLPKVVWLKRYQEGKKIDVSCLALGKARILNLPGEAFVEFQLEAKAARPDLFVAVAAYGDYGPGYIGTAKAYTEGGYETTQASAVAPEAEAVLMTAIRKLLHE